MNKPIILLFIITSLLSCKKSNDDNSGSNPPPGGSSLTITSISPANPYPDDNLVITGTGFNADKTKDTVEFGQLVGGGFGPYHDGGSIAYQSTIVSATSTQLVIKAVDVPNLDYYNFANFTGLITAVRVTANSKSATSAVIPFKRLPKVNTINNPDNFNNAIGRPADSLIIHGSGFGQSGSTIKIDGTTITTLKIDSGYGTQVYLRVPKLIFGENNDESIMTTKKITLIKADGKTSEKDFNFWISPQMVMNGMAAEHDTYSKGTLAGNGGIIKITVSGKNLKSDCVVHIDGSSGTHTQSALGVSGFPDSKIIEISPAALLAGNYQISIWRTKTTGDFLEGSCNFTLNP